MILSHIPPFISDPLEASGYFPLARDVRLRLLQRAAKGGASHWFAGHYHRNAGGTFDLEMHGTARDGEEGGGSGSGSSMLQQKERETYTQI